MVTIRRIYMIKPNLVSLGARIPSDLKKIVTDYCDRNGIKVQFFVAETLRERLKELREEQLDVQEAQKRIKDAEFIGEEDLKAYVKRRKKR